MQSHRLGLNMQCTPAGAEEGHQDSKELFNETGVPIEPFNLDRERERVTLMLGVVTSPTTSLRSRMPGWKV